jgi:hypothetical protein
LYLTGELLSEPYETDPSLAPKHGYFSSSDFDATDYGVLVFDRERATLQDIEEAFAATTARGKGPSRHLRKRVFQCAWELGTLVHDEYRPGYLTEGWDWDGTKLAWRHYLESGSIESPLVSTLDAIAIHFHGGPLDQTTIRRSLRDSHDELCTHFK